MRMIQCCVYLIVAALVGCGVARTVSPEQAEKERGGAAVEPTAESHSDHGSARGRSSRPVEPSDPVVTPIYEAPIDEVQGAAARAAIACFGRLDLNDVETRRLHVNNRNFWAGDTKVDVRLEAAGPRTIVHVEVKDGPNRPLNDKPERDLRSFITALDAEMQGRPMRAAQPTAEQRLRELDDLHSKGLITDAERAEKRAAILAGL